MAVWCSEPNLHNDFWGLLSTLLIEWYFYSVGVSQTNIFVHQDSVFNFPFKFFLKPFFLGSCLSRKWVKIIQTVCPPGVCDILSDSDIMSLCSTGCWSSAWVSPGFFEGAHSTPREKWSLAKFKFGNHLIGEPTVGSPPTPPPPGQNQGHGSQRSLNLMPSWAVPMLVDPVAIERDLQRFESENESHSSCPTL